jgi:hypothetical protein
VRRRRQLDLVDARRCVVAAQWAPTAAGRSQLGPSLAALERPGFTYDTEPACRAVVAVRTIAPANALATRFLYAAPGALFVGDAAHSDGALAFDAEAAAVVAVRWAVAGGAAARRALCVVATADVALDAFVSQHDGL